MTEGGWGFHFTLPITMECGFKTAQNSAIWKEDGE